MFLNKRFLIFIFFIITTNAFGAIKENVINNLKEINSLTFQFEQNINGKKERGKCAIKYPKKIFCKYDLKNNKILVSNGKSLVIKTLTSYYIYPLEKTSLNYILDKNFLLKRISNAKERIVNKKYIHFSFNQNDNEINIFFDSKTYNIVGWQLLDIYQNLNITYLDSIIKNQILDKDLFKLPAQN